MTFKLQLCPIAKVVILLLLISIALDIYVFGTTVLGFSLHIVFGVLYTSIANWGCYNKGYKWVSWMVALLSLIGIITILFLIKYRYTIFEINKLVEDEKSLRYSLGI